MLYAATVSGSESAERPNPHPKTDWIERLLGRPEELEQVRAGFSQRLPVRGESECWEWPGAEKRGGYGCLRLPGRHTVTASRLAYALHHGHSPGALYVCHRCDNPPCCNPAHLFLGTCKDNAVDMVAKGRARGPARTAGEHNGNAKLTAVQIGQIRELIRAGLANTVIARRYGVTHQLISRIRRGRSWGEAPMCAPYERRAA